MQYTTFFRQDLSVGRSGEQLIFLLQIEENFIFTAETLHCPTSDRNLLVYKHITENDLPTSKLDSKQGS